MKTNKKAILGFALAIVVSLAVMQGNSLKSNKQDVSIQQLGGAAAWGGSQTEGGTSAILNYTAATLGGAAVTMTGVGVSTIYISGTTPVGWGYWAVTGGIAL